jgi:hypothetical protein
MREIGMNRSYNMNAKINYDFTNINNMLRTAFIYLKIQETCHNPLCVIS